MRRNKLLLTCYQVSLWHECGIRTVYRAVARGELKAAAWQYGGLDRHGEERDPGALVRLGDVKQWVPRKRGEKIGD